jgi:hypothetical protein
MIDFFYIFKDHEGKYLDCERTIQCNVDSVSRIIPPCHLNAIEVNFIFIQFSGKCLESINAMSGAENQVASIFDTTSSIAVKLK